MPLFVAFGAKKTTLVQNLHRAVLAERSLKSWRSDLGASYSVGRRTYAPHELLGSTQRFWRGFTRPTVIVAEK